LFDSEDYARAMCDDARGLRQARDAPPDPDLAPWSWCRSASCRRDRAWRTDLISRRPWGWAGCCCGTPPRSWRNGRNARTSRPADVRGDDFYLFSLFRNADRRASAGPLRDLDVMVDEDRNERERHRRNIALALFCLGGGSVRRDTIIRVHLVTFGESRSWRIAELKHDLFILVDPAHGGAGGPWAPSAPSPC